MVKGIVVLMVFSFLAMAPVASAEEAPRLMEPLPLTANVQTNAAPEGADYMTRVRLHTKVLGLPEIEVGVAGESRLARLKDSYRRYDGESFFYTITGEEEMAVFTSFYDGRPVYGRIVIGGKGYFISGNGDGDYVVSRTRHADFTCATRASRGGFRERNAFAEAEAEAEAVATAAKTSKQRACCSGELYRIPLVVDVDSDYLAAVGSKERVEARVAHTFDRLRAALWNSGAGKVVPFYREIAYVEIPAGEHVHSWAVWDSTVNEIRRRNKAGGSLVLSQKGNSANSVINSPDFVAPANSQVVASGGFWDDWDDSDIKSVIHEIGHFLGGDHNLEAASLAVTTATSYPFRHDWVSCEQGKKGALSYEVPCAQWLERTEIYSGQRAVAMGYPMELGQQDNVRMFHLVAPLLAHDFD